MSEERLPDAHAAGNGSCRSQLVKCVIESSCQRRLVVAEIPNRVESFGVPGQTVGHTQGYHNVTLLHLRLGTSALMLEP